MKGRKPSLCFFNENDLKDFTYYKFPKALLFDENYKNMSDSAKILYMIFYDRLFLSQQNSDVYADEMGLLYIRYSIQSIMKDTNWSRDKVKRALACLTDYDLIYQERKSRGVSYCIYVSKLNVDNFRVGLKRAQGWARNKPRGGLETSPY